MVVFISGCQTINEDVPKKFNVEIFKQGKNKEKVVNKSKTTGEPPLMLAMSVFYAIKDAIASAGEYKILPILCCSVFL